MNPLGPRRLFSLVLVFNLSVILLFTVLFLFVSHRLVRDLNVAENREALSREAGLARRALLALRPADARAYQEICRTLVKDSGLRITIVLRDGTVYADTHEDPSRLENHAARPELRAALAGAEGMEVRRSETLGRELVYLSIPFPEAPGGGGALRLALPAPEARAHEHGMRMRALAFGGLLCVLGCFVAYYFSRWLSRPLEALRRCASRIAAGEGGVEIGAPRVAEVAALAEAMRAMSDELDARFRGLEAMRAELEASLAANRDALAALDERGRLLFCNPEYRKFLQPEALSGVKEKNGAGYALIDPTLSAFVQEALASEQGFERELQLSGKGADRSALARAAFFEAAEPAQRRLLVSFTDVTSLRQLSAAQDEVNAMLRHDLKGPLTGLLNFPRLIESRGNLDEKQLLCLTHIKHAARRMRTMIESYVRLAKIEGNGGALEIEAFDALELLRNVRIDLAGLMGARGVGVRVLTQGRVAREGDVFPLSGDAVLCEAMLGNLVKNAVEAEPEGSQVTVTLEREQGARIVIHNQGAVDPAIKRDFFTKYATHGKKGGTGLGAYSARLIARAHGGEVTLESSELVGATVTVFLPEREVR
jgi:two-component system phosphate regulon sensor histidine kinase PhoR